MKYLIEKHIDGFVLVRESGNTVNTGAPHMRSALMLKNRKDAEALADLMDVDTFEEKEDWTPKHYALYETIPAIVRDIAGDLFEVRRYQQANYDGIMFEVEHNLLGKDKLDTFKAAYDSLTDEQKNLIYYAYEA